MPMLLGIPIPLKTPMAFNIVGNDNKVTKSYPWQGGTRYEASVDTRVLGNNNESTGGVVNKTLSVIIIK